jgi:Chlorophyll A-B binding protein
VAEIATESKKPHYMMGGGLPEIVFPPADFSKVDKDIIKLKRSRELNNGRLAMIAIMSFISEHNVPGSVPLLSGLEAFH